jgi:hypothetical protein
MPTIDEYGIKGMLKKQTDELQPMLDRAEKVSRISLKVAYISLGISIAAVILAVLPLIPKGSP